MKKVFYSLALIAFASLLFSCGGGVEEQVLGKWKVETASITNIDEIVDSYAEMIGDLTDEEKEEFKTEMETDFTSEIVGTEFIFNEDKTMKFDDEDGTWSIDEKVITIKEGSGDEELELQIDKISGSNFDFTLIIKEEVDIKLQIKCNKVD